MASNYTYDELDGDLQAVSFNTPPVQDHESGDLVFRSEYADGDGLVIPPPPTHPPPLLYQYDELAGDSNVEITIDGATPKIGAGGSSISDMDWGGITNTLDENQEVSLGQATGSGPSDPNSWCQATGSGQGDPNSWGQATGSGQGDPNAWCQATGGGQGDPNSWCQATGSGAWGGSVADPPIIVDELDGSQWQQNSTSGMACPPVRWNTWSTVPHSESPSREKSGAKAPTPTPISTATNLADATRESEMNRVMSDLQLPPAHETHWQLPMSKPARPTPPQNSSSGGVSQLTHELRSRCRPSRYGSRRSATMGISNARQFGLGVPITVHEPETKMPNSLVMLKSVDGAPYLSIPLVFKHITLGGQLSVVNLGSLGEYIYRGARSNVVRATRTGWDFNSVDDRPKIRIQKWHSIDGMMKDFAIRHYLWMDYPMVARLCIKWWQNHQELVVY